MNGDRSQVKTVRLLHLIGSLARDPTGGPTAINKRFSRSYGPVCVKTTERDLALLKADLGRHFRGNGSMQVNRGTVSQKERRNFAANDRMQAKLVRILRMIDMLAGSDQPRTLVEINRELDRVTGTTWCNRTIRRDLGVLVTMAMVKTTATGFELDRQQSAAVRCVACDLFNKGRP